MNLIKSPTLTLSRDLFSLTPEALAQKEAALIASAPIGRVSNKAENDAAAAALKGIKGLSGSFERQRKDITEPFLQAQREIMRLVTTERDDLEKEAARLEGLMVDFAKEELRIKREAEELQRKEVSSIEAARQEVLEKATARGDSPDQIDAMMRHMDDLARIESAPIPTTRAYGQSNRKVWKITQINDFQLMKARPDLVRKIEWDMVGIKAELDRGQKLPGVTAEEDLKVVVRGGAPKAIEV